MNKELICPIILFVSSIIIAFYIIYGLNPPPKIVTLSSELWECSVINTQDHDSCVEYSRKDRK